MEWSASNQNQYGNIWSTNISTREAIVSKIWRFRCYVTHLVKAKDTQEATNLVRQAWQAGCCLHFNLPRSQATFPDYTTSNAFPCATSNVLSGRRTIFGLPLPLLQACDRPLCSAWRARPRDSGEDSFSRICMLITWRESRSEVRTLRTQTRC